MNTNTITYILATYSNNSYCNNNLLNIREKKPKDTQKLGLLNNSYSNKYYSPLNDRKHN